MMNGEIGPGSSPAPDSAEGATPGEGLGAQVSRFFDGLVARVRDALPKASEDDFRMLSNTIPKLSWVADGDGSVFWYNQRWYEYTGKTLEEMQGWGWRDVHHPDHVDGVA